MQGQASQDILDETGGIQGGMDLDKGVAQASLELLPLPLQHILPPNARLETQTVVHCIYGLSSTEFLS